MPSSPGRPVLESEGGPFGPQVLAAADRARNSPHHSYEYTCGHRLNSVMDGGERLHWYRPVAGPCFGSWKAHSHSPQFRFSNGSALWERGGQVNPQRWTARAATWQATP